MKLNPNILPRFKKGNLYSFTAMPFLIISISVVFLVSVPAEKLSKKVQKQNASYQIAVNTVIPSKKSLFVISKNTQKLKNNKLGKENGIKADTMAEQAPPIDPALLVVTPDKKVLKVSGNANGIVGIPYKDSLIPNGYSVNDIYTFSYNKTGKRWEKLEKVGIDTEKSLIYSQLHADRLILNGILKLPEFNGEQSTSPMQFNNSRLAESGDGVQIISPPTANQQGSAMLQYPIEVPKARSALEPKLAITYNSDIGKGLLGEGWDLSLSSITVDTRWGTPTFNSQKETETYLLDGEMLAFATDGVAETSQRDLSFLRAAERPFYLRREKRFEKIIRHGNDPSHYWWEIIDNKGFHYWYGEFRDWRDVGVKTGPNQESRFVSQLKADPNAEIYSTVSGNITEWKLTRVEDMYGNCAIYTYKHNQNLRVNGQPVSNTVIQEIDYNRREVENMLAHPPANYRVIFNTSELTDFNVSGRYGFFAADPWLIKGIDVLMHYSNKGQVIDKPIRSYVFDYDLNAPFKKVLLKKLILKIAGKEFYHHDFTYYNDIANGLYASPQTWNTNLSDIDGLSPSILPSSKSTALGGNLSSGNSFSFYGGVGFNDFRLNDRSVTVGYNAVFANNDTRGVNALVDIDGDGLPDEIICRKGALSYHKNTGQGFSNDEIPIKGIGAFSEASDYSNSSGISAYFGVKASLSSTTSAHTVSTYFLDVNGDGLMDIIKDGVVYFNHLEAGSPVFSSSSDLTAVPITGATIDVHDPTDYNQKSHDLAVNNPLLDVVRVWKAPFSGHISITAPVSLIPPDLATLTPQQQADYANLADGVWIAVQKNGQSLNKFQLNKTVGIANPLTLETDVNTGDRIYFRLMSGVELLSNGDFDLVDWQPAIKYLKDNQTDIKALPKRWDVFSKNCYEYNYLNDYLLSNPAGLKSADTKNVLLGGSFKKGQTINDIIVEIIQYSLNKADTIKDQNKKPIKINGDYQFKYSLADTVFKRRFAAAQSYNGLVDQPLVFTMRKDTYLGFLVKSDVNADIDQVNWIPILTEQGVPAGAKPMIASIVPNFQFNGTMVNRADLWSTLDTQTYKIQPELNFNPLSKGSGKLFFTIRQNNKILKKVTVGFLNGLPTADPFSISLNKNDLVFGSFETADTSLSNYISASHVLIKDLAIKKATLQALPGEVFKASSDGNFVINHHLVFLQDTTANVGYQISVNNLPVKNGVLKYQHQTNLGQRDIITAGKNDAIGVIYKIPQAPAGVQPVPVAQASFSIDLQLNADLWINNPQPEFGPMFRGWGQFTYNDPNKRSNDVIDESLLHNTNTDPNGVNNLKDQVSQQILYGKDHLDGNPDMSSMNAYNPRTLPFGVLNADADATGKARWDGPDASIYIDRALVSSSRLGLKNVVAKSPFSNVTPASGTVTAPSKVIESNSTNYNGGFGDVGGSLSNGNQKITADFFDVNGDRFPDVIGAQSIQLTGPDGKLSSRYINQQLLHKSQSKSNGAGIASTNSTAYSTSDVAPKVGSANLTTSIQNISGAFSGANSARSQIGMNGGLQTTNDWVSETWLDVNGDGLPDRITNDGQVSINLGTQGFLPKADWGFPSINIGQTYTVSPYLSIGFDNGDNSISGGIGLSVSRTWSSEFLEDLNGDGLVDKIIVNGKNVSVAINTGHGFQLYPNWLTLSETSNGTGLPIDDILTNWNAAFNSSTGTSIGGDFTFGFAFGPLIPFLKASFSPGFYHNNGIGTTLRQFIDINGDGFPDYVYADNQDKLYVSLSRIGYTNKLHTVSGPLGLNYVINYSRSAATPQHPQGKIVLATVSVDGGAPEVRAVAAPYDKIQLFSYEDGFYDFYERQFLGFGKVTTYDMGYKDDTLRSLARYYANHNYYTALNMTSEKISDGQNKLLLATNFSYDYIIANPGTDFTQTIVDTIKIRDSKDIYFTPVKKISRYAFDINGKGAFLNSEAYTYDNRGDNLNVVYFDNAHQDGNNNFVASYQETKTFYDINPQTGIFGLIKSYTINSNDAFRTGAATYDQNGRILTTTVQIAAGLSKNWSFTYLNDGNLNTATEPSGLTYKYSYDGDVNLYPTDMVDNRPLNLHTKTYYNPIWGFQTYFRDVNGNETKYEYDDFGRCIRIRGPNEFNNPDPNVYTIRYDYDLNLQETHNWTDTYHYDQNAPGASIIYRTFVDGFRRHIQLKKTGEILSENGQPNDVWITSGRVVYDALGRPYENFYPSSSPDNNYVPNPAPVYKGFATQTYDALDRKLITTLPDNNHSPSVSMSYGIDDRGNVFENTRLYNYDNLKPQSFMDTYDGSGMKIRRELLHNGNKISTVFHYNAVHQLQSVTGPSGTTSTWTYFDDGSVKEFTTPEHGAIGYTYNSAGQLLTKTTSDGEITKYSYDQDHLIGVDFSRHPAARITYVYGSNGGQPHDLGKLVFVSDASGGCQYGYDAMGNISTEIRTILAPYDQIHTYGFTYKYDSWGRLQELDYPDKEAVKYQYDRGGLLKNVKGSQNGYYVNSIGYDVFGKKASVVMGKTKTDYHYDDMLHRLKSVDVTFNGGMSHTTYNYDLQGTVVGLTGISQLGDGFTDTHVAGQFGYNDLGQLETANDTCNNVSYQLSMKYDNSFNPSSNQLTLSTPKDKRLTSLSYQYNNHDQQLENIDETHTFATNPANPLDQYYNEHNGYNFSFDANGNNTGYSKTDLNSKRNGINIRQVRYGINNELMAVNSDGAVTHYVYDHDGARTLKMSTAATQVYVNGAPSLNTLSTTSYSIYVNQYLSSRNAGQLFNKQIFAGQTHIATVMTNAPVDEPNVANYPGCNFDDRANIYRSALDSLKKEVSENYDYFDLPHPKLTPAEYAFTKRKNPNLVNPAKLDDNEAVDSAPGLVYYYHSGLFQNVAYVSDKDGKPTQAINYLPFGQTFLEQRKGYSSQFNFSGKETDNENGLSYFGSRYYDSKFALWMGTDPEESSYPGLSPYNFCLDNPMRFIDKDGRQASDGKDANEGYSFLEDKGIPLELYWGKNKNNWEIAKNGSDASAFGLTISSYAAKGFSRFSFLNAPIANSLEGAGNILGDMGTPVGAVTTTFDIISAFKDKQLSRAEAWYKSAKSLTSFGVGVFAAHAAEELPLRYGVTLEVGTPVLFGMYAWGVEREYQMLKDFMFEANHWADGLQQQMIQGNGF